MTSAGLRRRRLDIIEEHLNTEVTKEFDRSLPTFNGHGCSDHSAYIPIPTGSILWPPANTPVAASTRRPGSAAVPKA
jgi:hypothetical protein